MHEPDPAPAPDHAGRCIGVFDSGVGGLSVLKALRHRLPQARLLYVADSGHAPYGERDDGHVVARSRAVAAHLLREGAQLLVMACNTATAAAADVLRADHPELPIVGVEPGLKPAIARTRNGRVGVMATASTLASAKFARLLREQARGQPGISVHLQACPGLARALERGAAGNDEVAELVERYTAPLRAAEVDVVALGCTHYPFAADRIAAALGPEVLLIDTAEAVTRQAVHRLSGLAAARHGQHAAGLTLWSSGEAAALQAMALHGLGLALPVLGLP